MTKGAANQKGFTLVELMIAAMILGITFVGTILTFVRCLELNEMSRNSSTAVKAVKSRIEQMKDTTFNQIFTTFNNTTFAAAGLTGMGVTYVDNSNPDLLGVTVVFCWREKSGRVIGEDQNLNGVLDVGEDLSSPANNQVAV